MAHVPTSRVTTCVPDPLRVYAIGDIHGRADLLQRLFDLIDQDIAAHPRQHAVQIFLGDYIDRGADSRQVIDLLIERGETHAAVFLSGNHEDVVLQALEKPDRLEKWMKMGAATTLSSYGIAVGRKSVEADTVMQEFMLRLPRAHHDFLSNLSHYFECGDFIFVHAGLRPGTPVEAQSVRDLLWIRDEFRRSTADHGKLVVHGHTPVSVPEVLPNRINIDTGAYMSNRLTCLVLQGTQRSFLRT